MVSTASTRSAVRTVGITRAESAKGDGLTARAVRWELEGSST
jgi:hypothetical protein